MANYPVPPVLSGDPQDLPDGYIRLQGAPQNRVPSVTEYDITYNITRTRDAGQFETRWLEDLDDDGYSILIPNHSMLKIVTIQFRVQSDVFNTEYNVFSMAGNLHHRIRSWISFKEELRGIKCGLLKVFDIQTSYVTYNSRVTHVATFEAEFTVPVNDLEIDQSGIIRSASGDGYISSYMEEYQIPFDLVISDEE